MLCATAAKAIESEMIDMHIVNREVILAGNNAFRAKPGGQVAIGLRTRMGGWRISHHAWASLPPGFRSS